MDSEQPPVITKDGFYGPILKRYVYNILKSRLLLDEDLEAVIGEFDENRFAPYQIGVRPYRFTAAMTSVLGTWYLVKKTGASPLFMVPPAILTTVVAILGIKHRLKVVDYDFLMLNLIDGMVELYRVNRRILRYLKARHEVAKKYESDFFTLNNPSVQEFLRAYSKSHLNSYQFTMDNMRRIARHNPDLVYDYEYTKTFDPIEMLKETKFEEMSECLQFTRKLQDVQVFLNSKFLAYMGVIFCDKYGTLGRKNVELFLDVRIPHMIKHFQSQRDYSNKIFQTLRRSMVKIAQVKLERPTVTKTFLSSKLNDTLECTLNNIFIIFEKTQNILEKIEKIGEDQCSNDMKKVHKGLLDVKSHTYATYESLDILSKLYGILANAEKPPEEKPPAPIPCTSKDLNETTTTVISIGETLPVEEKYELYLSKEDPTASKRDEPEPIFYEEQSATYIRLMLKELRHSLKHHERFIEARKRRGSEDLEDKQPVSKSEPPQFNRELLIKNKKQPVENKAPTPTARVQNKEALGIPSPPVVVNGDNLEDTNNIPPVPPPMPMLNGNNTNSPKREMTHWNSLLEDVKAFSSQLGAQEETFGDITSDSE